MGASSGAHFLMRIGGMSSGPAAESDFNFLMTFFYYLGPENYFSHDIGLGGIRGRVKPLGI